MPIVGGGTIPQTGALVGWGKATAGFGTYSTRNKGAQTRSIPFTDETSLYNACLNMQAGDYIFNNTTTGFDITGHQFTMDIGTQPASEVVIDFGYGTNAVRFGGWPLISGAQDPNSANLFAMYCPNLQHITMYGGDFQNPSASGVYTPHTNFAKFWYFKIHNLAGDALDLVPNTGNITNSNYFGEIYDWGHFTAGDPHAEKGTGIHGCQFGDGGGSITNNTVALLAHDGPTGAAIQYGSTTGAITGNTVYLKADNLTKVSTSQVAGNGFNLWGSATISGTFAYVEVNNAQGFAVSVDNEFGTNFSSCTFTYARSTNTRKNPVWQGAPTFNIGPTYTDASGT